MQNESQENHCYREDGGDDYINDNYDDGNGDSDDDCNINAES
jgi:hypothetical protein